MATRIVKGKARTESPRLKDVPRAPTGRDPRGGRDARGRFTSSNGAAVNRGAKQIVRESLGGNDADPDLVREAVVLYRACMRDLPSDGPSVRQLTASRCRHAVLATRFASEATKAGLTTSTGIKLAEQARAHDLAAQRLAVTAYDLATREAAAAKSNQSNPWLSVPALPEETTG